MATLGKGWTQSVITDLRWLVISPKFESCSGLSFSEWWGYIKSNGKSMSKDIRRYSKERIANVMIHGMPHKSLRSLGELHCCNLCDKSYGTFQSLSLHLFKAHGVKNIWRRYIDTTICTVCLKEFWCRERVLNHIRRGSRVCQNQLHMRGPILTEAQALAIDQSQAAMNVHLYRQGQRRHKAMSPVIQMQGPLLPIMLPEGQESHRHALGRGHNYFG